jgi:2-polyprenyl-6-methoxyphenol hydroxylase-like FAD-dependent oxidoreductase
LSADLPAGVLRFGARCIGISTLEGTSRTRFAGGMVQARFADGSTAEGDLLIEADGHHAEVRAALSPDRPVMPTGTATWQGPSPASTGTATSPDPSPAPTGNSTWQDPNPPSIPTRTATSQDPSPAPANSASQQGSSPIPTGTGTATSQRPSPLPTSTSQDSNSTPTGTATWQGLSSVPIDLTAGNLGVTITGPEGECGLMPAGEGLLHWWFDVPWSPYEAPPGSPVAELRRRFGGWQDPVPQVLAALNDDDAELFPHYQHPIDRHPIDLDWGQGLCTLVGNSVPASPSLPGQGASRALGDAWQLVRSIRTSPADARRALRDYERARLHRAAPHLLTRQ